jgi:ribosome-associated translation inhibitor RaiA|tara:strand:+ start:414 stop:659 length:246 start_codon:yes stop_codon:yes gene_type:complete
MVQNKLLQASIDKYKAEISEALATLDVYFNKPVAIGEHPDLLTEIDKYVEKLETATGKLETLQRYFDEHADVDTNKKLLKG